MASAPSPQFKAVHTSSASRQRNRKDVLGLATLTGAEHPTLLQSFRRLAQAGFTVTQTQPEHWIIRGKTPLPEFHCYSEQEIHQLTSNKTGAFPVSGSQEDK